MVVFMGTPKKLSEAWALALALLAFQAHGDLQAMQLPLAPERAEALHSYCRYVHAWSARPQSYDYCAPPVLGTMPLRSYVQLCQLCSGAGTQTS